MSIYIYICVCVIVSLDRYKRCISMISLANYCLYCIVVPQIEQ